MPGQELRDYQGRAVSNVMTAFREGAGSVLLTSPTGSGKTTIFSYVAANIYAPVLINVHRRELATQAAARLREFGVDFGIIMAGEPERPNARVQVASIDTLLRRIAQGRKPRARLLINDEAHLSTANKWQRVRDEYPEAKVLGATATPWRLSGKPLADAYDRAIVVATPAELHTAGWLCGYVGFSYKTPDLSKVGTSHGDYNEQQSAVVMSDSAIVDNIVEQWIAHASHLSTVVFAVTVEHSLQLTRRFRDAGVLAEHVDGSTPLEERKRIMLRVESGQTMVLCNVGVAVEGLDIPRLKCCVLARPTKSRARAIQMMGRVLRPWNGLLARIHDHAFVIKSHGRPFDDRDYSLHSKQEDPPSLTQCEKCFALYRGPNCPACNHENAVKVVGERVLEMVDEKDLEQFGFSSDEPATPAKPKVPVNVKWTTEGRVLEGVYVSAWDEQMHWGTQRRYLISGKKDFILPGTARHDQLMSLVKPNELIRVTYLGRPDGTKHAFDVEVDR